MSEVIRDSNTVDVSNNRARDVIVILDQASLETVKTKKGDFQLLNCDDHVSIMRKNSKDPAKYRPDIVHQELMALLDSPLNKAGKLQVYVHTEKNVLIEINPKTRLPRTFKRFSGLMVQLLHRLKIRSADGNEMLLKVIKNPMSRHLPAGATCYGLSHQGTLISPTGFVASLDKDSNNSSGSGSGGDATPPIVFVFGAMATGSINPDDHPYLQNGLISLSEYPLSGVVAINRLLGALENHWGII